MKLARSPGLMRGVRSPRSYLFRMAHRLAIDQARQATTQIACALERYWLARHVYLHRSGADSRFAG